MNRKELMAAVAASCGLTHQQTAMIFEAIEAEAAAGLKRDGHLLITGFGTFERREHAPRALYDPNSGTTRLVPGNTTVGFKPALRLKKAVERDET